MKIAILGYKSNLVGEWDPDSIHTGLPGSEEAVVYLSQSLAKMTHIVHIYMNPKNNTEYTKSGANPLWIKEDFWVAEENENMYDLVIMWRRLDVNTGRMRGKCVFFWPHDSPANYPVFPNFDANMILSAHHYRQFLTVPNFRSITYGICGNGLVPEQFSTPFRATNKYSIGYFSNYARGLEILLLIWPKIREEYPEATLAICYGRETWNTMSQRSFGFVVQKIEEYKNIGVTEYGKIGHYELAKLMEETSIWAYPCNYLGVTETFCITAIKAQAAGMIPVTTRLGALNETVHPEAPSSPNINNLQDVIIYQDKLLETMTSIGRMREDEILELRQKFRNFGLGFTWDRVANLVISLYQFVFDGRNLKSGK